MSEPPFKKRKLNPDIQSSTIHNLDIRRLISYNLPLKDQLTFNSITAKCYNQITNKERKSANELHTLAKGVIYKWNQVYILPNPDIYHYKYMEKYSVSVIYTDYNPLIINTMDGRTFTDFLDALIWLFDNY